MSKNEPFDLSIYYAADRCTYISERLSTATAAPGSAQLESMANYILYGKESNSTQNAVQKKQIQIKTKSGKYDRKAPVSLDSLTESPTFDEARLKPIAKSVYRKLKPTIDREADADVPGLPSLWAVIDELQRRLNVLQGKDTDPTIAPRSNLLIWHLKNFLIEVRTQQYYLRDSAKPPLLLQSFNLGAALPPYILWNDPDCPYAVAPLGILYGNDERFYHPERCAGAADYIIPPNKFTLDFCNKEHIYQLLENYSALKAQVWDQPQAPLRYIMETLDFYVEAAELPPSRKLVLERKIDKMTNGTIQQELRAYHGLSYNTNYISTIWKQEICGKIAKAAQLHRKQWDARDTPLAWRTCKRCQKPQLLTENYRKSKRAHRGYLTTCKKCEKQKQGEKLHGTD